MYDPGIPPIAAKRKTSEMAAARFVCPAVLRPTQTVRAGVKQYRPPAAIQVPMSVSSAIFRDEEYCGHTRKRDQVLVLNSQDADEDTAGCQ